MLQEARLPALEHSKLDKSGGTGATLGLVRVRQPTGTPKACVSAANQKQPAVCGALEKYLPCASPEPISAEIN